MWAVYLKKSSTYVIYNFFLLKKIPVLKKNKNTALIEKVTSQNLRQNYSNESRINNHASKKKQLI